MQVCEKHCAYVVYMCCVMLGVVGVAHCVLRCVPMCVIGSWRCVVRFWLVRMRVVHVVMYCVVCVGFRVVMVIVVYCVLVMLYTVVYRVFW